MLRHLLTRIAVGRFPALVEPQFRATKNKQAAVSDREEKREERPGGLQMNTYAEWLLRERDANRAAVTYTLAERLNARAGPASPARAAISVLLKRSRIERHERSCLWGRALRLGVGEIIELPPFGSSYFSRKKATSRESDAPTEHCSVLTARKRTVSPRGRTQRGCGPSRNNPNDSEAQSSLTRYIRAVSTLSSPSYLGYLRRRHLGATSLNCT